MAAKDMTPDEDALEQAASLIPDSITATIVRDIVADGEAPGEVRFYVIGGRAVEVSLFADTVINRHYRQAGKYFIRKVPGSGERQDHQGPFDTPTAALAAYLMAHRPVVVTQQDFDRRLKDDYAGWIDGKPMVLRQDPWAGGTILSSATIA